VGSEVTEMRTKVIGVPDRRFGHRVRSLYLVASFGIQVATAQAPAVPPEYHPSQRLTGTLRNYGADFGGLLKAWEKGFKRYQADLRFADSLPGSDVATSGLIAGVADIGVSGREPMLVELEAFHDSTGTDLVQIPVATGTLDVKGSTWTPVVLVRSDNPIEGLTLRQLDGIFGAERTGGYEGYRWSAAAARSAGDDIRTWDQLGLQGEWAGQPIHTFGYAPTGMSNFFQLVVMGGGTKWNPNYREYVEAGSKLISAAPGGDQLGTDHMFAAVSADKFAIAWGGLRQSREFPALRPVPLAAKEGGPYIAPTRESLQDRTYPLTRSIYMFVRRDSHGKLDSRVKEFLSYILSRQGQADTGGLGIYLPLTAQMAVEQRSRLE
jgi:phosphate transport system substrate-binding protein